MNSEFLKQNIKLQIILVYIHAQKSLIHNNHYLYHTTKHIPCASCNCFMSKYFGRSSPAIISFCDVIRRSGELVWIGTKATCGTSSVVFSSEHGETHSVRKKRKSGRKNHKILLMWNRIEDSVFGCGLRDLYFFYNF